MGECQSSKMKCQNKSPGTCYCANLLDMSCLSRDIFVNLEATRNEVVFLVILALRIATCRLQDRSTSEGSFDTVSEGSHTSLAMIPA